MEHILENSIITEKYINEIKKLNQIKYEKYIETRFHLTIKYLIPDSFSNNLIFLSIISPSFKLILL